MKINKCPARHVDAEAGKDKVVDRRSTVVPDIELLQGGTPRNKELAFRAEIVAGVHVFLANVYVINKAGFRYEPRAEVPIEGLQIELSARALQVNLVARSGGVGAISVERRAGHGLALHTPVLVEFEVGVGAADAIVAAAKFTISKDGADRRLLQDVAADAADREGRAVAAVRVARRHPLPRSAIVSGQNAHRPRT